MAYALVTGTKAAGVNSATTPGVDTTGATLLVVALAYYVPSAVPVLTDSKGNTWAGLTASNGANTGMRLYYALNPTVGAAHTFTSTRNDGYQGLTVAAFSGADTVTPFDQQAGATATATSVQPGSVTPSEDDELVVCSLGLFNVAAPDSVDGGFTVAQTQNSGGGSNFGCSLAYLIQTTAAAANPTWSWTGSDQSATRIATFKAGAGGGGGGTTAPPPWLSRTRFFKRAG